MHILLAFFLNTWLIVELQGIESFYKMRYPIELQPIEIL